MNVFSVNDFSSTLSNFYFQKDILFSYPESSVLPFPNLGMIAYKGMVFPWMESIGSRSQLEVRATRESLLLIIIDSNLIIPIIGRRGLSKLNSSSGQNPFFRFHGM